jgi:hypothetical protein
VLEALLAWLLLNSYGWRPLLLASVAPLGESKQFCALRLAALKLTVHNLHGAACQIQASTSAYDAWQVGIG